MPNPIRGEVALPSLMIEGFTAGGTLVLDWNALCVIEDELKLGIDKIVGAMFGSALLMRSIFRAALMAHHPGVDDVTAGRILHELGYTQASELLMRSLRLSFPEVAEQGAEDPPTREANGASGNASPSGAS